MPMRGGPGVWLCYFVYIMNDISVAGEGGGALMRKKEGRKGGKGNE